VARLEDAGAAAMVMSSVFEEEIVSVLFNRFYQPDIDIERRDVALRLQFSDQSELLPRLRWIAILSGRLRASPAQLRGCASLARCPIPTGSNEETISEF